MEAEICKGNCIRAIVELCDIAAVVKKEKKKTKMGRKLTNAFHLIHLWPKK